MKKRPTDDFYIFADGNAPGRGAIHEKYDRMLPSDCASEKRSQSILAEALRYRELGLSVIPIPPGTKKASCPWKPYQTTPASDDQLRRWFAGRDDLNLAVVCGQVSGGLVIRDFDERRAYERWARENAEYVDRLPTVETARGCHVYCRWTDPVKTTALEDGELRGEGVYCLVPPSTHPQGTQYRWKVSLTDRPPVVDPWTLFATAGRVTESTESNREHREHREQQRVQRPPTNTTNGSVVSVLSVTSPAGELETAILESLPDRQGRRNKLVFELARGLKSVPALADAEAQDLKPYVQKWHDLALPVIGTIPFEETWIDFLRAWPRVKFPKGKEPMARIFEKARTEPLPEVAAKYEQADLKILVALCRELQRAAGESSFYLSARTAGRLLGRDHMTAWRWLFLLEEDGILQVVQRGSQKTGKATRFRYANICRFEAE